MAETSVGELLSELNEQLSVLQSESSLVKENIKVMLEKKWPLKHAELFPCVCHWRENLGSPYVMAFHCVDGVLSFEPFLSYGVGPTFPTQMHLEDVEQGKKEINVPEELMRGVLFSVASREVQIDFNAGYVVLPFQLFENVTGLFLVNVGPISGSDYENIVSLSYSFLHKMRKIISGQVKGLIASGVRAS